MATMMYYQILKLRSEYKKPGLEDKDVKSDRWKGQTNCINSDFDKI